MWSRFTKHIKGLWFNYVLFGKDLSFLGVTLNKESLRAVRQPESYPWSPHGGRKETTPTSSPLSTCALWHPQINVKMNNWMNQWIGRQTDRQQTTDPQSRDMAQLVEWLHEQSPLFGLWYHMSQAWCHTPMIPKTWEVQSGEWKQSSSPLAIESVQSQPGLYENQLPNQKMH